jgi:uncharacterized SAM-binding protein YcdF (DUF218 family)
MEFLSDTFHFFRTVLPELLMPPAGLVWLILAGALIGLANRRAGALLAGLGAILLFILSMPAVGGLLIASLEHSEKPDPNAAPPGAIIILGADGDRTREPGAGAVPGPLSLQRLTEAALIARKTNLPVLITGGEIGANEPPVAKMMADQFNDAFGLPAMWQELKSANTCENARFSAAILRRAGVPAAYVVTHAWHMPRALLSFRRAGYAVIPAPVHADAVAITGISDFLPHTSAWIRSFYALHEWIGLIAYRFGACPASAPTEAS